MNNLRSSTATKAKSGLLHAIMGFASQHPVITCLLMLIVGPLLLLLVAWGYLRLTTDSAIKKRLRAMGLPVNVQELATWDRPEDDGHDDLIAAFKLCPIYDRHYEQVVKLLNQVAFCEYRGGWQDQALETYLQIYTINSKIGTYNPHEFFCLYDTNFRSGFSLINQLFEQRCNSVKGLRKLGQLLLSPQYSENIMQNLRRALVGQMATALSTYQSLGNSHDPQIHLGPLFDIVPWQHFVGEDLDKLRIERRFWLWYSLLELPYKHIYAGQNPDSAVAQELRREGVAPPPLFSEESDLQLQILDFFDSAPARLSACLQFGAPKSISKPSPSSVKWIGMFDRRAWCHISLFAFNYWKDLFDVAYKCRTQALQMGITCELIADHLEGQPWPEDLNDPRWPHDPFTDKPFKLYVDEGQVIVKSPGANLVYEILPGSTPGFSCESDDISICIRRELYDTPAAVAAPRN